MNTFDFLKAKQNPAGEPPVFVDDSGRKQRNMKRAGYLMAILCAAFLGMVGVGLATENVGPSQGLPGLLAAPFSLPPAALGKPAVENPKPVSYPVPVRPRIVARPPAAPAPKKCDTPANGTGAGMTGTDSACAPKADPKTDPKTDPTDGSPTAPDGTEAGQPANPSE